MASNTQQILEAVLPNFWPEWDGKDESGLRTVALNGMILRDGAMRSLILTKLKGALPDDARLWAEDGKLCRPVFFSNHMTDQLCLVFASKEWPQLEPSGLIPSLEFRFYQDSPKTEIATRLLVDRRTHSVVFENETETTLEVVILPKKE